MCKINNFLFKTGKNVRNGKNKQSFILYTQKIIILYQFHTRNTFPDLVPTMHTKK